MNYFNDEDCITALATPWAPSAVAVIRMSGKGSITRAAALFSPGNLNEWKTNRIGRGVIRDRDGQDIDEVMAAVYRKPKSYTGQDSVEFFCHGSLPVIESVLTELKNQGFRDALPGEFTLRAFLNGKKDLTESEAVNELIQAKTKRAGKYAFSRLNGDIRSIIEDNKKELIKILGDVEIQLDYPEDEVAGGYPDLGELDTLKKRLARLAESYAAGRLYQEGSVITIGGRTNAGKSSLFNRLLKEDRAIVSPEHGTTRDYLDAWITVKGIPVRIVDTAGLRKGAGHIEIEGIRRSRELIAASDGIIYVLDAETGMTDEDREFLRQHRDSSVLSVWNKVDRFAVDETDSFTRISAVTGKGLEELEKKLAEMIMEGAGGSDPGGNPVIDSLRQKTLLDRAVLALERAGKGIEEEVSLDLLSLDLREALDSLGEITGEVSSADVLEDIFSRFCVGK
ncbi:MAG: tRNA uridine-5-carboxymethylaminomethyl(34) synthesis GTPase MnmE [Spirochaetia bacterium]